MSASSFERDVERLAGALAGKPGAGSEARADAPSRPEPKLADHRHRPGERIGSYLLEKPLGRGGFSEVWLARTVRVEPIESVFDPAHWDPLARTPVPLGRVALKLLVHDEHVAELKQEAKALGVVRGEGIVRTLEANLEHDPPYLALEYHEGGDLRHQLAATGGRYSPARALWLVERLLETLTRVHREGIVHGDLKPENVLFGKDGTPLLADFGLSRRILQRTGTLSVSLSQADARLAGTIDYMAPEQRAGEKPTLRSDVYAVGVILHELVFGERPQGFSKKATERDPRLPPLADRILEHALAPDPRDRFESAAAFLKALRVELWNDARSLEATSRGLRERIVLGHAWTVAWGAVVAGAWLIAVLGDTNSRTRLFDLFDLDLLTGALAATLPLVFVRPVARRWRTKHSVANARIAQQLETLDGWRKVSAEAPPSDEPEPGELGTTAASSERGSAVGGLARTVLAVGAAVVLLSLAIGSSDVWRRHSSDGAVPGPPPSWPAPPSTRPAASFAAAYGREEQASSGGPASGPTSAWRGSSNEGEKLAAELGALLGREVFLAPGARLGPGPGDFRLYDALAALRAAAAMNGCVVHEASPGGPLEVVRSQR